MDFAQLVFSFRECSLPAELCDKHQALKKKEISIETLGMSSSLSSLPVCGESCQPVSLGVFCPSFPSFIYSLHSFTRQRVSASERRQSSVCKGGLALGWEGTESQAEDLGFIYFSPDKREPGFGDKKCL